MTDAKPWWTSVGLWSSICTVLFGVLAGVGIVVKLPPQDAAQAIVTLAPVVAAIVAGIGAAFGRARATAQLTATRAEARRIRARMAASRYQAPGQWP